MKRLLAARPMADQSRAIGKANAAVHILSALYVMVLALVFWALAPPTYFSTRWVRVLLLLGGIFAALDLTMAFIQWRGAKGRVFSVALHLIFVAAVVATITYQYRQDHPEQVIHWFKNRDFWFISLMAMLRLITSLVIVNCSG